MVDNDSLPAQNGILGYRRRTLPELRAIVDLPATRSSAYGPEGTAARHQNCQRRQAPETYAGRSGGRAGRGGRGQPVRSLAAALPLLPGDATQENFHHRNSPAAAKRLFRSHRCRGCVAFGNRIRRQQQPEAIRARDRQRAQQYYLSLTLVQKMQYRTSKEANNLATKRHRARQNGIPVLIQKAGRLPILVKPICRVAATCPLRSYCTVESKNLA